MIWFFAEDHILYSCNACNACDLAGQMKACKLVRLAQAPAATSLFMRGQGLVELFH